MLHNGDLTFNHFMQNPLVEIFRSSSLTLVVGNNCSVNVKLLHHLLDTLT
jgi:hypothetical protein